MRWSLIFAPILLSNVAMAAEEPPARAPLPSWMTGAWGASDSDRWGDEYWTPPRGGLMIGAAREGRGPKLLSWESTRISYDEAGKLAFWAMPRWVPATKFAVVEQTPASITFANPAHDYPQRVKYWREGKTLNAEISLIDGKRPMRFTYTLMGG